jgi:uncharacterized metal-binding protein
MHPPKRTVVYGCAGASNTGQQPPTEDEGRCECGTGGGSGCSGEVTIMMILHATEAP